MCTHSKASDSLESSARPHASPVGHQQIAQLVARVQHLSSKFVHVPIVLQPRGHFGRRRAELEKLVTGHRAAFDAAHVPKRLNGYVFDVGLEGCVDGRELAEPTHGGPQAQDHFVHREHAGLVEVENAKDVAGGRRVRLVVSVRHEKWKTEKEVGGGCRTEKERKEDEMRSRTRDKREAE